MTFSSSRSFNRNASIIALRLLNFPPRQLPQFIFTFIPDEWSRVYAIHDVEKKLTRPPLDAMYVNVWVWVLMVLCLVNSVGLPISPQTHLEHRKQIAWVRCCCCDYNDHATVNTFTINIPRHLHGFYYCLLW